MVIFAILCNQYKSQNWVKVDLAVSQVIHVLWRSFYLSYWLFLIQYIHCRGLHAIHSLPGILWLIPAIPWIFTFQSNQFFFNQFLFPRLLTVQAAKCVRVDTADIMTFWQKHKKMFRCDLAVNKQCLPSPGSDSCPHSAQTTTLFLP